MSEKTSFDFGAIDPILNSFGFLYNIGNGIYNTVQNARNDRWNKEFAQKQFDYQKEINDRNQVNWQTAFDYQKDLNNRIMQREDNSVQRRAADLESAGISKNLAAGSSAQATSLSGISGGNTGVGMSSGAIANANRQAHVLAKIEVMNAYSQYRMMESERNLKDVQAIVEAKQEGLVDEQIATEKINQLIGKAKERNLDADTEGKNIRNRRDRRDEEIDKDRGSKSTENESSYLTSAKSYGVTIGKFLSSLLGREIDKVDFNSGGKFSESELIDIIKEYNELAYEKYGSINSTSSHVIYDKFFRAFYDSIPGKNVRDKQAWISKYRR